MNTTNTTRLGVIAFAIGLAGCATSSLPRGARLVGGGLMVGYEAPTDGTAILIERTSARIVATESLDEGNRFEFSPEYAVYDAVMFSMFGDTNAQSSGGVVVVPTNTFLQLYFVPEKTKKK